MAGAALRTPAFVPSQGEAKADSEREKARKAKEYFAEMERRVANVEAGRWTEHELIEVVDA